jgi:tetratricopeptide (TPR) repeat protein
MELTIEQALQKAIESHREGKLQVAESMYRAILQVVPNHPDANHNLGVLAVSLNKTELALPLFKTALETNSKQVQFWFSYVDALIKTNQLEIAKSVLEQGKKLGLAGERVDALEEQLRFLETNLLGKKPKSEKLFTAIEFRETGRYQEAQEWLINFLRDEPNDAEGWSLLSQIYMLDKKDAKAEKALHTAISFNSNLPSVFLNQARLLLKKSNPKEALLQAQSGYEQSSEDPESWIVLAACLTANQRDLEALAFIERALQARPNYPEAFANRALIRISAKNINGAIQDLEKAAAIKPHLTQTWGLLWTLHYQNKNLSAAVEALKKLHLLDPSVMSHMINLGELLRQDQRIEEAIAILQEATQKAPKNANAWINLGTALQQDNKIAKAKLAYKKALAINPNSAEASNNLGSIAKDTQDWKSALKYFEKAIAFKPDLAEAHSNLGITLQELGRLEDAEVSYSKAIAVKPEFAEAHSNLGLTLQKLGRLEDAEMSLRKAIAIKSDLAEAHSNLGLTLRELGRLEDSVMSLRKAITIKPDLVEAHGSLGNTLKELNRLEDAEASYSKAIEINPDYAEAHSNLGITLQELGRLEDAETSYSKAIEINPEFAEAYSNLGLLLMQKGNLEGSRNMHERAIKLDSQKWNIFYNYSTYLHEIGHVDSARDAMKNAESIAPKNKLKQIEICLKAISAEKNAIKAEVDGTYRTSTNLKFGLRSDPLILIRPVDDGLIAHLCRMNSRILDKTIDARYGNGKCSIDFELFNDKSQIVKAIAQDLTKICRDAVASEVYIYDSFFNIYGAGAGTKIHNHINSNDKYFDLSKRKYSLVYYLDVGDQSGLEPGVLRLFDSDQGIMPLNGMIVIINANKKHHALYDGKTDRIMIGVNFYSI